MSITAQVLPHLPPVSVCPMTHNATDGFIRWGRAKGWSARTTRQYAWVLRRLEGDIGPVLDADTDTLRDWLAQFDGLAQASRRAYTNVLRSFYLWCHEEGLIEANPMRRVEAPPNPDGIPRPIGEAQYRAALDAASGRMLCWLLLGGDAGLRRAEIAAVCGRDIAGRRLHVVGKGGRHRVVPLTHRLADELHQGGLRDGRLWNVSAGYVGRLIREHFVACGVDATPHQLRHRAITAFYIASGGDVLATQRFSGHRSVQHVQRYCALADHGLDIVDRMMAA